MIYLPAAQVVIRIGWKTALRFNPNGDSDLSRMSYYPASTNHEGVEVTYMDISQLLKNNLAAIFRLLGTAFGATLSAV
jgi:hypothetical protein